MILSPYLISLQRLALESQLYGFSGLAMGTRGMLVRETLNAWLESRGPTLVQPAEPPEPPEQTYREENQSASVCPNFHRKTD